MASRLSRRRQPSALERLLGASRPEAPPTFVRGTTEFVQDNSPRYARAGVVVRTVVLSAAVLGGLATFGGLGYAKSVTSRIAVRFDSHSTYATQKVLAQTQSNAALDQYGAPPDDGVVSTATVSGSSGAIVAILPGTTAATTVKWTETSFPVPVNVTVDPNASTALTLDGTNNQVVKVTITSLDGQVQHELVAPIEIVFQSPPAGYVPAVSQDGVTFRALTLLAGPPLPDSLDDGFYVSSNGDIHILTRHVTYFAIVAPANIGVSASGKQVPPAGSGLFGDPTRNHPGPPGLQQLGALTSKRIGRQTTQVRVGFQLDEQANLTLSVVDAAGNPVGLGRSTLDGQPLTVGETGLQFQILKPGPFSLAFTTLGTTNAAQTYKLNLAAVDFDGLTTTRSVPIAVPALVAPVPTRTTPGTTPVTTVTTPGAAPTPGPVTTPSATTPPATTPATTPTKPHRNPRKPHPGVHPSPQPTPTPVPPSAHMSRWSRWWRDVRTAPHRLWQALPAEPSRWWWVVFAGLGALTAVLSAAAAIRARRMRHASAS